MLWYEEDTTPRYATPPVVETAMGVVFQPVPGLGVIALARLQDAWRSRYPRLTEHPGTPPAPTLTPPPDAGAAVQLEFGFGFATMPIRLWAEQEETGRLVQTQNDRLVLNWRASFSSHPYPHYEALRDEFERLWAEFQAGVQSEGLPAPAIQSVEFTYVNSIALAASETVEDVVAFISPSDPPLPGVAAVTRFQVVRQVEGPPLPTATGAQVWIVGEPQYGPEGQSLQLTITSTVTLSGGEAGAARAAIDAAHALGAHTFAAVTTAKKQAEWGRQ